MRTVRSSRWLLSLLPLVTVLLVIRGQAASDSALIVAARNGDLAGVRAQIAKRVDVNEQASDGSTALLWAAYHSDLDMTRALIAAGAKVGIANRYGVTPLLQSSRTGAAPVIQALIRAGADAKPRRSDTETPLMAAARTGSLDAVKLLLEVGADVNATDAYQKQTALMWAAAEGHADVVKALLAAGADPNRKAHVSGITERKNSDFPTGGFTALMFAAREGHEAAVRALIAGGADPKLTNGDDATAMSIAIVNDRFDLAKTMLDLGADANDGSLYFAVDMHDATTDMRARDGSRLRADFDNTLTALDLVKLLLDKGADPNKAFVGKLHHSALCCDADHQRVAVLPGGAGGRCRSAEADDRQGRAGRVEPDRGEEGAQARCRRRGPWPRQSQPGPHADDGGDERRPRRGVRRRARLRPAERPAFPRGLQPRAVRGDQGAAGRGRQPECQGARWLHAAAPGRERAAGADHQGPDHGRREARRGEQGQPHAAAAGREAGAAAAAGQQRRCAHLSSEAQHPRRSDRRGA